MKKEAFCVFLHPNPAYPLLAGLESLEDAQGDIAVEQALGAIEGFIVNLRFFLVIARRFVHHSQIIE